MYIRDYSKCCEDSFRHVSIQNFNNHFEDINYKLEACVERHAPLTSI